MFLDQKFRSRDFEGRNGRTVTKAPARNKGKGRFISAEKNREIAINGKQTASVPGDNHAASVTKKINVEKATMSGMPLILPLLHQSHRRKTVESRKVDLKRPCREFLKRNWTIPSCDYRHPPECQKYETKEGCSQGEKCSFLHSDTRHQPNKKPKKDVQDRKDTVAMKRDV